MGFIFVSRSWVKDKNKIKAIFADVVRNKTPIWVVTFLEGTRMTKKKLAASQAFAKKRDLPVLRNLMLPRVKVRREGS